MSAASSIRTVVHIGYPKCASTYLQKTVFPRFGNFSNFGNLSGSAVSFEERALLYHRDMKPEDYRTAVQCHQIPSPDPKPYQIISSESYVELPFAGFERNTGRVARRKGIDLSPYDHRNEVMCENLFRTWPDACILIVIREPLSWAVSRYDHWYRRDLVDGTLEDGLDSLGESYDRLVRRYQERFGRGRVRVVPYEWLNRDPGKFARAVGDCIDPDFRGDIPNIRTNTVPSSAAEIEYERMRYRIKHRAGIGKVFLPLLKPVCRLRYGTNPLRSVVSEATRQRLRPQLCGSNRRIEELTGLNLGELGYDV